MVTYKIHVGNKVIDPKELGISNSNDLRKIDLFTLRYKDENEFYNELKKIGLITGTEERNIYIQYMYKYMRNIDVLYSRNTMFFLPDNLENSYYKIQDAMYGYFENKRFLRELYFYCKDRKNPNSFILANYLNEPIVEYGEKNQIVFDICESFMVKYSNGNMDFDYKNARDLALLIYKYSCKKKNIEEETKEEKSIFTPLEGEQMSFFKK